MAGWVTGIREVRHVTVAADGGFVHMQRGPVMTREVREVVELPPEAWARLLNYRVALPTQQAIGRRCGTAGVLAWSVKHLLDPLAAYYATYEPPLRWGSACGSRAGK